MGTGILAWVEGLEPRECTTDKLFYDHMESQSDRCLPIIYQPFDTTKPAHWSDRGWLFDFVHATGSGRVLDFGPGDGWPSLILAPFVDEVVGVDASRRRVDVCCENAQRLEIANARFVHVQPGNPLPFEEGSFDGIAAASSIEQTPDPYATLCELYRVLRPGGKLRVTYEALSRYRGTEERSAGLMHMGNDTCRLVVYDRQIDKERALHYALDLDLSQREALQLLTGGKEDLAYQDLTVARLERLRGHIVNALTCTLRHPSGATLVSWLKKIGFGEVRPSYAGGWYAWALCERLSEDERPQDLASLDRYLRPLVETFVQFGAPIEADTPITATK